jgi:hypothetical protein
MPRPRFAQLACLAAWALAGGARADDAPDAVALPPDQPATLECDQYSQVSCTGTNAQMVADVDQLAVDTRDGLAPLIGLGPTWRYPVHITLVDPAPGRNPQPEAVNAIADGQELRVEAALSSDDPEAREFIQRQFVNALLWEKFFKPGTTFTTDTHLDIVPLWLVEGLREYLNDDPEHDREEIVKRAALADRAPTLAEVTGWKDISTDRLLGLWQRAFCYYLVDCLIHKQARREDFQQWLAAMAGPNPGLARRLFPTEMGWQRELHAAGERSRSRFFTWDESAAELTAAETIALPKGPLGDDTRLCTIETVATFPRDKALDAVITQKIYELTALELRVHPSWQPIIELYRFGLTALVRDNDPKRAADYLHQAHVRRAAEMDFHDKLVDYANWYEVTQDMPNVASHFTSYFRVAQELDKAEGDPQHPNPIRADLLKVESEF